MDKFITDHAALAEKLADYKQADDDGVMCLVSRQAVDEAVAALRAHPAGGVSEDVVERAAAAMYEADRPHHDPEWSRVHESIQAGFRKLATTAFSNTGNK